MDYQKHYNALIRRSMDRRLEGYFERHHVVPRCVGGDDSEENLVYLTAEEHYLAHQLLIKIYPKEHKLLYAARMMTVDSPTTKRGGNKLYGWLKRKYQNEAKKRTGERNPSYGKRWFYDPVTLRNKKCDPSEAPKGWKLGRITDKELFLKKEKLIKEREEKAKELALKKQKKENERRQKALEKERKRFKSCDRCGKGSVGRNKYCAPCYDIVRRQKTFSSEARKKMSLAAKKNSRNKSKGTVWITNGSKNRRLDKESEIPQGWYRGRITRTGGPG